MKDDSKDAGMKRRRSNILTYIFIVCYVIFLIAGSLLSAKLGGVYPYVTLVLSVALLFGLIYFHASVTAYVCPNCQNRFKIGVLQDMLTMNGGKRGKYLKCPRCGHRAWMTEAEVDS